MRAQTLILLSVLATGCSRSEPPTEFLDPTVLLVESAPAREPQLEQPQRDLNFNPRIPALDPTIAPDVETALLIAAADYRSYTRIAEDPHYSPTLCAVIRFSPDSPLISRSDTDKAHGRKLYFLWVRKPEAYMALHWKMHWQSSESEFVQPFGQVLVKETFVPGPGADPENPRAPRALGDKADLFVMLKLSPGTPGTDNGWVYATLTPDGQRITSSGRLSNCMGCHRDADNDRMFGLPFGGGMADTGRFGE